MHPEVRAYFEVERVVRRRRVVLQGLAVFPGLVAAVELRALTHFALGPGFEGHVPVIAAVAMMRAWLSRWAAGPGLQLAAQIAARHGSPFCGAARGGSRTVGSTAW